MTQRLARIAALSTALLPTAALAHVGVGDTHGFSHGFMHPLGGLDHVLAMVAVGLYAAHLGRRALWLVPAAFVGMMAVGGLLGISAVEVPYVEIGIGLSVAVLGLAVALQVNLPTLLAMALVGLFAIFHGHAHGAEIPEDAGGLGYAAGFMLATALLHAVGIGLGLSIARLGETEGKPLGPGDRRRHGAGRCRAPRRLAVGRLPVIHERLRARSRRRAARAGPRCGSGRRRSGALNIRC